jgi:hypothetical protein
MPDLRRFSLLSLLALVAAFGLAACGSDDAEFDRAAAEDQAVEEVEDRDAEAEDASCDEPDPIEDGEEFDCEVELENGEEVTVAGEITNDDGDFRLRVDREELAQAQGEDEGGETTTPEDEGGGGGEATGVPAELESTIRDFQNAVIDNDASGACVELSDPALEREFGGFTECLSEFESSAPEGSSRGDDLVIQEVNVTGDEATANVLNPGTGVTSEIKLIDEGGTTGWAIDQL